MTDYKKLKVLIERGLFPTKETRVTGQVSDISEQVINSVLVVIEEYFKQYDIEIYFEKFKYPDKNKGQEKYKEYLADFLFQLKQFKRQTNTLKKKPLTVFKEYMGSESKNIFTYIEQIVINPVNKHIKFITPEVESYKEVRRIISELSNVPINILNLKDEKLFTLKLDELIEVNEEDEIIEEVEDNPLFLNEDFEKMRLKYVLEQNNETIHKVGFQEFQSFPELVPSFIDSNTISDNKILSHIFIEGYHGTGKTTLAQQIAFLVDNEHSFYINSHNFENKIMTDKDKGNIKRFIGYVHYHGGTIVIDDMNKNIYAKTFSRECLQEANKIDLKLIFISSLEQHNDLTDIKTFADLFYKEKWEGLKANNLYIELSIHKKNDEVKIKLLENMLINYLHIKNIEIETCISRDDLDYLNNEFGGLLYLLKMAIDNQPFKSLQELKIKQAQDTIVKNYKTLVDKQCNATFIHFSIMDLYLRIGEDQYYNNYLFQRPEIAELINGHHMYLLRDYSFNKNVTLSFPNMVIPIILSRYLNAMSGSKFNLYTNEKSLVELLNFSSNNIMNTLRYLRIRRKEVDNFYKLSRYLLNIDSFSASSTNKLNLIEIGLLISSFIKNDFSKRINLYTDERLPPREQIL